MGFSSLIVICFLKIELALKIFAQNNWINVQYKTGLKKSLRAVLKFCIETYNGYYKQSKLFINWVSRHNSCVNLCSPVPEKIKMDNGFAVSLA